MPIRIYGITGSGGSESGGKSLILPDNIDDLIIQNSFDSFTLNWTTPASEIPIDHYNVYIYQSNVPPESIDDFTFVSTTDSTGVNTIISNLSPDTMYYVLVTSVSIEGYENASLRGIQSASTILGLWYTVYIDYYPNGYLYYSEDGETWVPFNDDSGKQIELGTNGSFFGNICYYAGNIFYNYSSWLYRFDIETKTKESVTSVGSGMDFTHVKMSGNRMIIYGSDGSFRYMNLTGNPEGSWISIESCGVTLGRFYPFENIIIGAGNIKYWKVYDFVNSPRWNEYGYSDQNLWNSPDLLGVAHGMGRYIGVGEAGYSVYKLDENLTSNSYIEMSPEQINYEADFLDIVFAKSIQKFFALYELDSVIYGLYSDDGSTWKSMNGSFNSYYGSTRVSGGRLIYANGRLIYSGNGYYSFYCVDGLNWIAMSGFTQSDGEPAPICSPYEEYME